MKNRESTGEAVGLILSRFRQWYNFPREAIPEEILLYLQVVVRLKIHPKGFRRTKIAGQPQKLTALSAAASASPQAASQATASALAGMNAAGWSAVPAAVSPASALTPAFAQSAPAAARPEGPISAAQLKKLDDFTRAKQDCPTLDKSVTDALGLTTGAQTLAPAQLHIAPSSGWSIPTSPSTTAATFSPASITKPPTFTASARTWPWWGR